jgi:alpha-tubulin suppressor-like RCC1 family protein
MSVTIDTILADLKTEMDNGAFLIKFRNASPIAVHKDWLFKEQGKFIEYTPSVKNIFVVGKRTFAQLTNYMVLCVGDLVGTGFNLGVDYKLDTDNDPLNYLPRQSDFEKTWKLLQYKERYNFWPIKWNGSGSGMSDLNSDPEHTLSEKEKNIFNLKIPNERYSSRYNANTAPYPTETFNFFRNWKVPSNPLEDIKKIVGNNNTVLYLTHEGILYGCGENKAILALENEDAYNPHNIIRVSEYDDIEDVWCGDGFAYIKRKGNVFMSIGDNRKGQLGTGPLVNSYTQIVQRPNPDTGFLENVEELVEEDIDITYEFVEVPILKKAKLFDCGKDHAIAVYNNDINEDGNNTKGLVMVTGNNNWGQLGLGFNVTEYAESFTTVPDIKDIILISAHDAYGTILLDSEYNLYATGKNDYGQLGVSFYGNGDADVNGTNKGVASLPSTPVAKKVLTAFHKYHVEYLDLIVGNEGESKIYPVNNIIKLITSEYNTYFQTDGKGFYDGPQGPGIINSYGQRVWGVGRNIYRQVDYNPETSYMNFRRIDNIQKNHNTCSGENFLIIMRTDREMFSVGINEEGQLANGSSGSEIVIGGGGDIIWSNHSPNFTSASPIYNNLFPSAPATSTTPAFTVGKIYTLSRYNMYTDLVCKWDQLRLSQIDAMYYKNDNGLWIDWIQFNGKYKSTNMYELANQHGSFFPISKESIPYIEYTDAEGYLHMINKGDGQVSETFNQLDIVNNLSNNVYNLSFISVENLTSGQPPMQHRNDLKIEFLDSHEIKNFLVWLNGVFVDVIPDDNNPKIGYIKNAASIIPTIEKCKRADTPLPPPSYNNLATVNEDPKITELRWNIKIKFFGWKDTKVSRLESPVNIATKHMVFKQKGIDVHDSLQFASPLLDNTFLLLLNGVILNESTYYIDKNDKRTIHLKGYYDWVLKNFIEMYNPEKNYHDRVSTIVHNNVFSIVRFDSKVENKNAYVYRDRNCIKNQPYVGEILFPYVKYDDLICVDGHYIPYEWVNYKAIRFPSKAYDPRQETSDFIALADIYRIKTYLH